MDAMLHALGGILLRAVPTFVLIFLVHLYLKSVFFRPLEKVLKARYESTEGARKLAEESLDDAKARTEKYENALFEARGEIFRAQEKTIRDLQDQQAAAIAGARASADDRVRKAKEQLDDEVARARQNLDAQSEAIADRIADTLLGRSAA